jgi:cytochrome b561
MSTSTVSRYPVALLAPHWLTLLLLIGVYASIEGRGFVPRGSVPREALKSWHFMLGLTVFGVTWLRLVARLLGTIPPSTPAPPAWQVRLARLVHVALYAIMLGMPLGGWLILGAAGKPVPWFA